MEEYFHNADLLSEKFGPEEFKLEYQVESERGFLVMGSRVFASAALLPMDPAHFSSLTGESLGQYLTEYEIPDNSWVWLWSRWYVDMTADVDDHGWCYSWRFRSRHWRGHHRFFRSFVRQRLWKRPMIKRSALAKLLDEMDRKRLRNLALLNESNERPHSNEEAMKSNESLQAEPSPESMISELLQPCRNDREKIDTILEYLGNSQDNAPSKDYLMGKLSFPISQKVLAQKIEELNKMSELERESSVSQTIAK